MSDEVLWLASILVLSILLQIPVCSQRCRLHRLVSKDLVDLQECWLFSINKSEKPVAEWSFTRQAKRAGSANSSHLLLFLKVRLLIILRMIPLNLSHTPLLLGWYALVSRCFIFNSSKKDFKRSLVKALPLSERISPGIPKLRTIFS